MTRLDDNATDLQGAASQDQAMQVMKQVEQDMEERAKKRETRRRERTIDKSPTDKLSQHASCRKRSCNNSPLGERLPHLPPRGR